MKQPITQTLRQTISTAVKTAYDMEISPDTIRLEHPADESNGDYASNIAMLLAGKLKQKPIEIAEKLADKIIGEIRERRGKGEIRGIGEIIESVEAAAPGFLNFRLNSSFLVEVAASFINEQRSQLSRDAGQASMTNLVLEGKKIMVEFAHPNTHKEFHIGHLRNICIGESLVRTLEACRATVFRANYEGDVGLHVAKALRGIYRKIQNAKFKMKNEGDYLYALNELTKDMTAAQKAEFLGQGYALGSKAYENDQAAKKEIIELNKRIFKDPQTTPLWKETRKMSLDYFDTVYKRLGSHFDRLFFESEVEGPGRQLVTAGVEKGIFIKDADGSMYFPGEKFGLNNCVFVTRENYATYEGKDMALEDLEYRTFPYDHNIHVVANEQINFFQIVFAALVQLFPYQKGRQYHLAYGMVKLKSGKMSSRTGEVITADELIDMAKEKIRVISQSTNQPPVERSPLPRSTSLRRGVASTGQAINQSMKPKGTSGVAGWSETEAVTPQRWRNQNQDAEETIEKIAVAAVKYTMLRVNPKQDIAFDLERSISLEGDSGPYLLYTYARCKSVMKKAETEGIRYQAFVPSSGRGVSGIRQKEKNKRTHDTQYILPNTTNNEEPALLRQFYRFSEVVEEAAKTYSPNLICAFLFDLAQKFNGFYNKHQIISQKSKVKSQKSNERTTEFRLLLTETTAAVLQRGLYLLGIETVERM